MGFKYGPGVYGPAVEIRYLDDIRKSLRDQSSSGPDQVYAIAMDVGREEHKKILQEKMLLFGVVTYASGQIGKEPVRSQGHIHRKSSHSGWSPPEIYEIWQGKAIIYMQEYAEDNPGKCYAVYAGPGEVVMVPPAWAHATISADPNQPLTFGAWCDREYAFEYEQVRARQGLAWYPLLRENGTIEWHPNKNYHASQLNEKSPENYLSFNIEKNKPIYEQFAESPDKFQFVSKPYLKNWDDFVP